jgi:hypothetical protein
MSCNIPEGSKLFSEQVAAAKDKLASLTADADKGIAAALGSLNADLAAEKEALTGKLKGLIPELPKPQANLQDQLTSMMDLTDDPGAMVTKFAELKKQFGSVPGLDLDKVMDGIGLDAKKLNSLDAKLSDAIGKGNDLINKAKGAADAAAGAIAGGISSTLASVAGGAKDAIGSLIGDGGGIGLPGTDLNAAKDAICGKVPNFELDEKGEPVKKGSPAKQAVADEEKPKPAAPPKKEVTPPVTVQNENIKKRDDRENESPTEREPSDNEKAAARRTYWRKVMKDKTGASSQLRALRKQTLAERWTPNIASRLRGMTNLSQLMKQDVRIMEWMDPEYPWTQANRDRHTKTIVGWELEYGLSFPDREDLLKHFSGQADLMDHWLNQRLNPNWPAFD